MNVTLGPHGAQLLRVVCSRHPERSETEIVEEALSGRFGREIATPWQSPEEVRAWLDELASLSGEIPPQPGETFSREMIYQDHA